MSGVRSHLRLNLGKPTGRYLISHHLFVKIKHFNSFITKVQQEVQVCGHLTCWLFPFHAAKSHFNYSITNDFISRWLYMRNAPHIWFPGVLVMLWACCSLLEWVNKEVTQNWAWLMLMLARFPKVKTGLSLRENLSFRHCYCVKIIYFRGPTRSLLRGKEVLLRETAVRRGGCQVNLIICCFRRFSGEHRRVFRWCAAG